MYTTKHAQILYRVASSQTIRNWAREFEQYLSPTATPEKGTTRHCTKEDMSVFALIAELSNQNRSFADIHAALEAGQRGDIPSIDPDELDTLATGDVEIQLSSELDFARSQATQLQAEIDRLKALLDPTREENIRLQTQVEDRDKRIGELAEQLDAAQQRIIKLAEEKGEAYVRGIMDAMKQARQQDND